MVLVVLRLEVVVVQRLERQEPPEAARHSADLFLREVEAAERAEQTARFR